MVGRTTPGVFLPIYDPAYIIYDSSSTIATDIGPSTRSSDAPPNMYRATPIHMVLRWLL